MKMALYLHGFPPSDLQTQSCHEKKLEKILILDHPIKYLTSTPQNCQGHEKKRKSEKLPQPRVV